MKLKAHIRAQALIRSYDAATVSCMVVHKGDPDAGALFVKVNTLDGLVTVYTETRSMDGAPVWRRGTGPTPVPERDADQYLYRQREIDCDAWVLEVEDPQHRLFFTEPVLDA